MKTLIVLSANPASGKSTWANRYAETHSNVKIISSDALRIEITGNYHDQTRQKEVWELFDKRINEYAKIDNVTVILDALNNKNCLRQKYAKENPEFDKYVLILFSTSIKTCLNCNSKRSESNKVPQDVMSNLIYKFEKVDKTTSQLFDEIYKYNWKKDSLKKLK